MKRSTYYKWLKRQAIQTLKDLEDERILSHIKILYEKHKSRYGVDRMTAALKLDYKIACNHKRVYRLMREHGLLAQVKRKKIFMPPGPPHPKKNILKRNFDTSCPFDKLATDMTEISISGKKVYVSPILDLHTKVIEAVEIGYHPSMKLTANMLNKVKDHAIPYGTYLHSDQGTNYNNLRFQKTLEDNNFIQSMSRKGTPLDNSPMECFFGILKSELLYNPYIIIIDDSDLVNKIHDYIHYYNYDRIQKGLGYLTPIQFKHQELQINKMRL